MEEKAKSEKEQREIKIRNEIDFCLCKFGTTVDSFPISQLGLVEDIRLYVGKVSDYMARYHHLTIKLKSIVETGDIGYQQCLGQGVDYIQSGNNLIEAMLKDADIAELNRVEGPDSIRCWNRIGNALRNSTNFKLFKTRLFTAYRAVPKSIFGIHEPFGIKRIFQLRVCLSPLLEHKMNHNFLDTPSNICMTFNLPENLEHFFLYCRRYTEARQNFLDSIMLLNSKFHSLKPKEKTKFFLYGDYSLSNDTNKSVLKATLKFLNDTGRFS